MKRRKVIKSLALLPIASALPINSMFGTSVVGKEIFLPSFGKIRPQESSLHRDAFVMDAHIHCMERELLQGLELGQRYQGGTFDLPRAQAGGLDALFFTLYTREDYIPGHYEVKQTFRLVELALDQIKKNNESIELALTATEIEQINRRGKMAAFLDLEGPFDFYGDLNLLRALYRMGLRSLALTAHNKTNGFIDTCNDTRVWGGLNEHGQAIIAEMNRLGMVIQVSHASNEAIIQAASASRHPIMDSHCGFTSLVDTRRNINDEAAKAIAAKGGVIGIQFGNNFNNPKLAEWQRLKRSQSNQTIKAPQTLSSPPVTEPLLMSDVDREVAKTLPLVAHGVIPDEILMGTDQLARVVDYGVNLVGEDHIALGSDFDGGVDLAREIKDVSDYPEMTKALQKIGYSEQRIRKILGLNLLRVIRQVTEEG